MGRHKLYNTPEEKRAARSRSKKKFRQNRSPEQVAKDNKVQKAYSAKWRAKRTTEQVLRAHKAQQKWRAKRTAEQELRDRKLNTLAAAHYRLRERLKSSPKRCHLLVKAQAKYGDVYASLFDDCDDDNADNVEKTFANSVTLFENLPEIDTDTRLLDTDTGSDDDDETILSSTTEYIPDLGEEEFLQEDDHHLDQFFLFLPRKKSKVLPTSKKEKKQDQEPSSDPLADHLETKFGLASDLLFYRQNVRNRPLLPVNSTVLRIVDPKEKLLSRRIVSIVRQIFAKRDLTTGFLQFEYILKCPPFLRYPIEKISERQLVAAFVAGERQLVKLPRQEISISTIQRDIYLHLSTADSTKCQKERYSPQLDRYLVNSRTGPVRSSALESFAKRYSDVTFISANVSFLRECHAIVLLFFKEHAPRLRWKEVCPFPFGSERHKFFYLGFLIFAMAQGDSSLTDPWRDLLSKFHSLKDVAANPSGILKFFGSRSSAKTKEEACALLSISYGDFNDDEAGGGGVKKGFNLWLSKAKAFCFTCKKLCLRAIAAVDGRSHSSFTSWTDYDTEIASTYKVESIMKPNSAEPLPSPLLDKLEDVDHIFPASWDQNYFTSLYGIHLKTAFLCAEVMYKIFAGPAFDCHTCRWTISLGIIPALQASNMSKSVANIKKVYPSADFPKVNETPGAIAQVLRSASDEVRSQLLSQLRTVASKYEYSIIAGLERFLHFYVRPGARSLTTGKDPGLPY